MGLNIDEFLKKVYKIKASDVHLDCNKVPSLRIAGEIVKTVSELVTKNDIEKILLKTMPPEFQCDISQISNLDYIYEIPGLSRYRVNYCRDIQGGKLTFRAIPYVIKSFEELSLPNIIKKYCEYKNGIIFVTGATGSGKSTTLASMIELINSTRKDHIITIEDPIEFVYEDKKSIITQRSLEIDVADFHTGIKYALRQDPDVILVGEIRDRETLLAAIEASETGHLVLSTLHTNGAIPSINRLLGLLDHQDHEEFLKRLSGCARAIIHQQLVPVKGENTLHPALELLTFTSTVCDYVKNGKLHEIEQLMKRSNQEDIITLNSSLQKLVQAGKITEQTAIDYSIDRTEMRQMLKGVLRGGNTDNESLL